MGQCDLKEARSNRAIAETLIEANSAFPGVKCHLLKSTLAGKHFRDINQHSPNSLAAQFILDDNLAHPHGLTIHRLQHKAGNQLRLEETAKVVAAHLRLQLIARKG